MKIINKTPIKIIHKFKNNNRRIQYIQYIFIGSIDDEIMNMLKLIKAKVDLNSSQLTESKSTLI